MGLPDYVTTRDDEDAYLAGYRLRPELGLEVISWIESNLCHSLGEWAGQPFILAPWERDITIPAFGWVHERTGLRRFQFIDVWVPIKNGKSTWMSCVGMYLLIGDGEPGAHIASCGYDLKQALIVHGEAMRMVEHSPALSAVCRINRTSREIFFHHTHSVYSAISHDASRHQGLNLHGIIADELHTWEKDDFWAVLCRRIGARRQPMVWCISSAGLADPEHFGYQRYLRGKGLKEGTVRDFRSLVAIHEASPDDPWDSPATWQKANPGLGITITEDKLASWAAEAKRVPRSKGDFLRYNLGVWVTALRRWLDLAAWDQLADPTLSPDELRSADAVYGGLDLATVDDMAAFCAVARFGDKIHAHVWYWCAGRGAEKRQEDGLPIGSWAADGLVTVSGDHMMDLADIENWIISKTDIWPIRAIGYDPYQSLHLASSLRANWGLKMDSCPQTPRHYNEAARHLEALIPARGLVHSGHPILRWNVSNANVFEDRAEHIMPVKPDRRRKIDGLVCLLMALGRMMFSESGAVPSVS